VLAHGSLHLHWFNRSGNQAGHRRQVRFSSRAQPPIRSGFLPPWWPIGAANAGAGEGELLTRGGGRARAGATPARPRWSAAAPTPGDGHPCAPVGVLVVAVSPRPERQRGGWIVDTTTRPRGVEERLMRLRVTYFSWTSRAYSLLLVGSDRGCRPVNPGRRSTPPCHCSQTLKPRTITQSNK
jgi:hypothetical protein